MDFFKSTPDHPTPEIARWRDFIEPLLDLRMNGVKPGLKTGLLTLDPFFTIRPREWTLVSGIPGHGKSTFIDFLMVSMSRLHGWHWAVFSAENWPLERHAATLIAQYCGKRIEDLTEDDFQKACVWLESTFAFLAPQESDYTVDHLIELLDKATTDDKSIKGIVIDPWNELDHARPGAMNETEYISRCLTKIRRFARSREVHIFVIAHPTKLQRNKDSDNKEPVPTPYDVSGSAHWRNKADSCICVWRDLTQPDNNETEVYIQKIRFREVGKIGMVQLGFSEENGQFYDLWKHS